MLKNNQTLQTGFRLIKILEALNEQDLTKSEIKEWFKTAFNISFSDESLKLYINTLIKRGFDIKRGHKGNNFKLHLDKNFVTIKLTKDETALLCSVKDYILDRHSFLEIMNLRKIYKKLSPFIKNEFQAQFLNFKFYDTINEKISNTLSDAIKNDKNCTVIYNSSENLKKEAEIYPEEINIINEKPYLKCYIQDKKKEIQLRLDNILSAKILNIKNVHKSAIQRKTKIKYKVSKKYTEENPLENNENLIDENRETYTIELNEDSEFFIVQKLILLGENCKKLNSLKIKNKVLENLKKTLELYK